MSAAHIEAGTEVTVTVRPWVMQCCCGLGGPATVAVVAVDVVAECSVQTAGWRPVRPPAALLCVSCGVRLRPGPGELSASHVLTSTLEIRSSLVTNYYLGRRITIWYSYSFIF